MSYHLSTSTLLHHLQGLPENVFVQATLGKLKKKSPCAAIRTFCQMRLVCSDLTEKVDKCWGAFIQQSGNISLLLPPSQKIDFEKAREFLALQYPTLKKWIHTDLRKWVNTDPEIKQNIIAGYMQQCIMNNHLGRPELWVMLPSCKILERVDLMSQENSYLELGEEINPVSWHCVPSMASSEKWIAICCDNIGENKMEINIIEIGSGNCFHRIIGIGLILQLQCDQEFLYVLSKDDSGKYKLLQYDSNDWNALPKVLCLPGDKGFRFYLGINELLFSAPCSEGKYQLLAIQKNNCFSSSAPSFITMAPLPEYPRLRVADDGFFVINSSSDEPLSVLSLLCIKESNIIIQPLQSIPIEVSKICDFHVQFDRIFILKRDFINLTIECFDLADGTFIKDFSPTAVQSLGTDLAPQLVAPATERIQLIYSSIQLSAAGVTMGNALMILDYRI